MNTNEAAFRRMIELGPNQGRLDALDEVVAPDCTYHVPVSPEPLRGAEAVKELMAGFRTAFADLHVEVTATVTSDDLVVARVIASGTHTGDLLGHAPTQRKVTWPVVHWARFQGGMLVEDTVTFDVLGLLNGLGLSPAMT